MPRVLQMGFCRPREAPGLFFVEWDGVVGRLMRPVLKGAMMQVYMLNRVFLAPKAGSNPRPMVGKPCDTFFSFLYGVVSNEIFRRSMVRFSLGNDTCTAHRRFTIEDLP